MTAYFIHPSIHIVDNINVDLKKLDKIKSSFRDG